MKRTPPAAPQPPRKPRLCTRWATRLSVALLLCAAPLTGCVEMSRTEKGRFGNPLQSHSAGPSHQFDAENYKPPAASSRKPWYERIFDW